MLHSTLFNPSELKGPQEVKKWIDENFKYRAPLIQVKTTDLRHFLSLILLAWNKSKDWEITNTILKSILENPKLHEDLIFVGQQGFHTHNLKIPNANVSQIGVMATPLSAPKFVMASSNTILGKHFGVAGNAAKALPLKLFTVEFLLEDMKVCLLSEIADSNSTIGKAFQVMGMPPTLQEKLHSILKKRSEQIEVEAIDRFSKQIFFPIRDGQETRYTLITPTPHTGSIREFHERIQQFYEREKDNEAKNKGFLPAHSLAVGGANPINAGNLNAELGGRHRHLLCNFPKKSPIDELDKWLYWVRTKKTLFIELPIHLRSKFIKALYARLAENYNARKERSEAIVEIAHAMLQPLRVLKEALLENPELGQQLRQIELSLEEQLALQGISGRGGRMDKDVIQTLSEKAVRTIKVQINKPIYEGSEEELYQVFRQLLKEE